MTVSGLTPLQVLVLTDLAKTRAKTAADIAETLSLRKSSTHSVLIRLTALGIVKFTADTSGRTRENTRLYSVIPSKMPSFTPVAPVWRPVRAADPFALPPGFFVSKA